MYALYGYDCLGNNNHINNSNLKKECDSMKNIIAKVKQMNLFQKIQVISALIPYYSCTIVNVITYFICWKKKLPFFPFVICSIIYGSLMFFALNCNVIPFVKYMISFVIALIGNYSLVCMQMREI